MHNIVHFYFIIFVHFHIIIYILQNIVYENISYTRHSTHERGPCTHCLRHLFVIHSFLKSETEGRALENTVPFLSAYLGHAGILETQKYLRASYILYTQSHQKVNEYWRRIPGGEFRMKKKSVGLIQLLSDFFSIYLPTVRGVSPNTIISYQYAFQLLFEFISETEGLPPEKVTFENLVGGTVTRYLNWLETSRGCSVRTRNQRRAAIVSFAKYSIKKLSMNR